MATFICSTGDDFIVQQEDRGYGGKFTEVLKCDGKTGTVTVAGQQISSSGVVGATGAVTATTGAFSGLLAAAAAVTVGTTLGVTGATTLTGALAANGGITISGKTVNTGSYYQVISLGIDTTGAAGDVTMAAPATVAGDVLVSVQGITTPGDQSANFESTVSVGGKLHQLKVGGGVDLSAKVISFLFHRP